MTTQTQSKHTPGKWKSIGETVTTADSKIFIADTHYGDPRTPLTDRGESNARLIAAAPELLEALKDAADILKNHYGAVPEKIEQAIAKAEGK